MFSTISGKHPLTFQSGVNGFLDVARQTYKEANDDAYEHVTEIGSKTITNS